MTPGWVTTHRFVAVDLEDPVHRRERDRQCALDAGRATGQPGAGAARHDRHVELRRRSARARRPGPSRWAAPRRRGARRPGTAVSSRRYDSRSLGSVSSRRSGSRSRIAARNGSVTMPVAMCRESRGRAPRRGRSIGRGRVRFGLMSTRAVSRTLLPIALAVVFVMGIAGPAFACDRYDLDAEGMTDAGRRRGQGRGQRHAGRRRRDRAGQRQPHEREPQRDLLGRAEPPLRIARVQRQLDRDDHQHVGRTDRSRRAQHRPRPARRSIRSGPSRSMASRPSRRSSTRR